MDDVNIVRPLAGCSRHASDPLAGDKLGRVGSTAVVYCEANFGKIDGKTANGLVRHSETYDILSVIDSEKAGLDSGLVLGHDVARD